MSRQSAPEPAWVLHTRPYRETSLIAELFTAGQGRLGVVVRGARGGRRGPGAVRQFTPLLVEWSGRGALKTLRMAESEGASLPLAGDALLAGLYVNELLLRVLRPQDPHEALFAAYAACLQGLVDPAGLAPALRRFERELLEEIGYGISFRSDAAGQGRAIHPDQEYVLDREAGFLPRGSAVRDGAAHRYPGAALLAIGRNDYALPEVRRIARDLFRRLLEPHLGGYPLESSRLLAASRMTSEGNQADG